jgi:hypothetical protein
MSGHVFKQSYGMATELIKVPLEIFFNPTILSGGGLFWEFSGSFPPPRLQSRYNSKWKREAGFER